MPADAVAGGCALAEPRAGIDEVAVDFGAAPAPKANMLVPDPLNDELADCNDVET